MTAADRPSVPRVGDTITTAEQLDMLPSLTVVMDANGEVQQRHGHLTTQDGDYSAWLGVMPPTCKPSREVALPATVLYVPGEQPRPSTDQALAEAWAEGHRTGWEHCQDGNYGNDHWDDPTPNPYAAAGRAETTTATPPGLTVSEDGSVLNWQGVNYVPQRAEMTTDATEDAARVLDDVIQHLRNIWSTGHDEAREVIDTAEELLAQALPRLLATARAETTTATTEDVVEDAYRLAYDAMRHHPGIWHNSLRAAVEALADAGLLARPLRDGAR